MTDEQKLHECRMTALNLRPKPRISTGGGRFFWSNGRSAYCERSLKGMIQTILSVVLTKPISQ